MTENETEYQTGVIRHCFVTGAAVTNMLHSLKLPLIHYGFFPPIITTVIEMLYESPCSVSIILKGTMIILLEKIEKIVILFFKSNVLIVKTTI